MSYYHEMTMLSCSSLSADLLSVVPCRASGACHPSTITVNWGFPRMERPSLRTKPSGS